MTYNYQNCKKAMTNSGSCQANFETLKEHVARMGYFPSKFTHLNNRRRYQRKSIKIGTMHEDQMELFEALAASYSSENMGGRKKKVELHGNS